MPESQADPSETPQAEASKSQTPEPPQSDLKKGLVNEEQQRNADRAKQRAAHEKVARKNPFSPENMAAKRAALLGNLRNERGVPPPKRVENEPTHEQKGMDASSDRTDSRNLQSTSESNGSPPSQVALDEAKAAKAQETPAQPAVSEAQNEWYRREQAVRAAEDKVKEASSRAELRAAEAEKKQAQAEEAVKRMEWAKNDPVAFLAETGMTREQWDAYLANGGKLSPEQEQMQAMRKRLEETQSRMEQLEQSAKEERARTLAAQEESQFAEKLNDLVYVPQMGGMAAIRQRQRVLSQQTGTNVTLQDAADHLETEMRTGLERVLQNPKIRSSLKLDVIQSDAGQVASKPRTLSNRVAPETSESVKKIHPLDWEAKKRLFNERVAREQAAKSGR